MMYVRKTCYRDTWARERLYYVSKRTQTRRTARVSVQLYAYPVYLYIIMCVRTQYMYNCTHIETARTLLPVTTIIVVRESSSSAGGCRLVAARVDCHANHRRRT